MNSPPFIPPLYFVKRGSCLDNSVLNPLSAPQRGGRGEFVGVKKGLVAEAVANNFSHHPLNHGTFFESKQNITNPKLY